MAELNRNIPQNENRNIPQNENRNIQNIRFIERININPIINNNLQPIIIDIQNYHVWYDTVQDDVRLTTTNSHQINGDNQHLGTLVIASQGENSNVRFFENHWINLRRYLDERNGGFTINTFNRLINSPELRNAAILY
jgi:hypothetical protein